MMRTVLILAAGEARRFNDGVWPPVPKQLIDLGGETLIARVIRQVIKRGYIPTVITHHPDVDRAAQEAGAKVYPCQKHRWLVETLWSSKAIWRGIVTVLYSDTIYSPAVLDALLTETRSPMFYGRWGDMFGWTFEATDARYIAAMETVLDAAEKQPAGEFDVARSWQLYRCLQGWDLYKHIGPTENNAIYTLVPDADYTRDIDTPGNWNDARRDVLAAGRLTDTPEKVTR